MASQSATLTTARNIGCMYAPHDPGGIPGKHHQPRSRWDTDLPFCVMRDPERRSSFEAGKREGDGRGWCWRRAREDETRDENRSPRETRLVHAAMEVSGISRPRRGENTNRNDPSTPRSRESRLLQHPYRSVFYTPIGGRFYRCLFLVCK